jgi:hypothetical protein
MSLRVPIRFDHSAVFPAGRSFVVLATHHCYAMGLIETAGCVANYGGPDPRLYRPSTQALNWN